MVTVGITGGMGSGKTTVCRVWEGLGAEVLHADDLAKQLMTDNESVRRQITDSFGDQSYLEDGSLNRHFLAAEAFGRGRVGELNRIVHPAVRKKTMELKELARSGGCRMFVKEAALLLDGGRPAGFDFIVLVSADPERRIGWIGKRDRSGREEILSRMNRQTDPDSLRKWCDFIIENDSGLPELEKKARELYLKMLDSEKTERS